MNERFLKLYADALNTGGCETTLQELIESLDLGDAGLVLEQIEEVRQQLASLKLELAPKLTSGDLNSYRILRHTHKVLDLASIETEIGAGEGPHREFKATLFYDIKRAEAVPETPLAQLKSQKVLHSTLKTVAAFLTCGGGVLFVGVDDSGVCSGIERDFPLIKDGNSDAWESELRSHIEGKFQDGKAINDYLGLACFSQDKGTVARIEVQARRKLSFVRGEDGNSLLYRRQGNRSITVAINEIEEFLEFRSSKGW
jgi:hypothetical protein